MGTRTVVTTLSCVRVAPTSQVSLRMAGPYPADLMCLPSLAPRRGNPAQAQRHQLPPGAVDRSSSVGKHVLFVWSDPRCLGFTGSRINGGACIARCCVGYLRLAVVLAGPGRLITGSSVTHSAVNARQAYVNAAHGPAASAVSSLAYRLAVRGQSRLVFTFTPY